MKKQKIRKLRQELLQYKLFENIRKLKYRIIEYKTFENHRNLLNDAEYVTIDWPLEISKPIVGLVKCPHDSPLEIKTAYWPKYQRFLEHNNIPYEFINIDESNWIDKCQKFDIVVWHMRSDPSTQINAKTKIYFLENYLKKLCHPSYKELWFYEEKIRQYYLFKIKDIPVIDTFITNDKKEALDFIYTNKYPFVSKINTGASSRGVELIKNKRAAKKYVNKVFASGRPTYWTYLRQKDYVYFQEFIHDVISELRVIVIGNKLFGYYRLKPKNDFRASGSGLYKKKDIPKEALLIAMDVKEKLNTTMLAVDMLKLKNKNNYKVIESSIIIQIDTAEQLKVNDVPGFYEYIDGNFIFKPGKYWIQEFALNEVMKKWIKKKLNDNKI